MLAPDRINTCQHHIKGKRRPGQTIRKRRWPQQDNVTVSQQRLWTRYIAAAFLRYSNHWRQTPILHKTPQRDYHINPIQQPTLHSYLSTLPQWYRQLLSDFTQLGTDIEIWRAFRSRRRLIIASGGSLLPTAGTFGWKLTTDKHLPLYHGAGPVDGPIDIGSSTRSEIGGFTDPLLLITLLARHWGLRHRCTFRWLVDSKIAINRVSPTNQATGQLQLSLRYTRPLQRTAMSSQDTMGKRPPR